MLRFFLSFNRLIKRPCERWHCREVEHCAIAAASRWLSSVPFSSNSRSYAKHFPLLSHPLPGLELPPCLPDLYVGQPTQITTLSNGVRIVSEDVPGPAACIGVFVDSGSIYETKESAGVSHLLEKLAFHDTKNRSLLRIARDVEATGGTLGASASREQMVYTYDMLKAYLPQAIEVLIDCIRNPSFYRTEVEYQLVIAQGEIQELQMNPEKFLQESLNVVGYSGALSNPLITSEEALGRISASAIRKFYRDNYTANRLVLAASGVDHQQLLDIAEPLLSDLNKGPAVETPKSTYAGGDFRHRMDSEMTHVALGFEVPGGWREEKDATIMTVIQTLLGGGGSFSTGGPGKGMHSRLYLRVLNEYQPVQSLSAFSLVYNDTGLFGIQLTAPSYYIAKAVNLAIIELIAIATPGQVTETELNRAKNSALSSVLRNLESRTTVTEDIGKQILTYGCRRPIDRFIEHIDEITLDDITAFAQKMLSSRPTMASWGDVDKVPTYEYVSKRLQPHVDDLWWRFRNFVELHF